jgi:hypothetical protein
VLVVDGNRQLVCFLDGYLEILVPFVGSGGVGLGSEVALYFEDDGGFVEDLVGFLGEEGVLEFFGGFDGDLECTSERLPQIALPVTNGIGRGRWVCRWK